ncbi:terminase large subunit [Listeria phage LP-032]|uniref:Terminase large subunit n=4 Tax=Homburgvirus TaxID=1921125 RepID=A0A6C0R1Q2_9CAUD|nr:terminase large subunit [Listeria phage LP-037]YP_009044184.1 terminase large subunit [Listeria phage LP-026]AHL18912.1 terminase large subunit [Listeria phage LP-032]QHZ59344.1 terminase large subunit [Listeria phage LP-018]AGI11710.1 terminase large subunit [Listeria phage LP-037]AHN84793.1 terminase large subunit [Listeria phage LP-026]
MKQEKQVEHISLNIHERMFNKVYLPSLEWNDRTIIFYGGAGSGKSVWAVQRSVIRLMREKRKMLVVRKNTNSLRDSVFSEFTKALSTFKLADRCRIYTSQLRIVLPNGSQILFKGIDNPEKIKSISGIDDIFLEEATELTLDDYTQLQLRMRNLAGKRRKEGQMILCYNPISKVNWVYRLFHDPTTADERPEDLRILHTTYKDNKFLPEKYLNTLEELMKTNPTYHRIYAMGDFASLGELVYTNWREWKIPNIHDPYGMQNIDPTVDQLKRAGLKSYFGLDFGYANDATAMVACIVDERNKKIYIYDEYQNNIKQKERMLNDDIVRKIAEKGWAKEKIVADSSEPKSIEEIRRKGIWRIKAARKGKDSIVHGIQFVQGFEIIVHPRCTHIREELENYAWQKDKQNPNEYINKPIDEYNHGLDALRYALEEVIPRNRVRTIPKSALGF